MPQSLLDFEGLSMHLFSALQITTDLEHNPQDAIRLGDGRFIPLVFSDLDGALEHHRGLVQSAEPLKKASVCYEGLRAVASYDAPREFDFCIGEPSLLSEFPSS